MQETESHKRYMRVYNQERQRMRLEASDVLAKPAGDATFNWTIFYTELYTRLGLEEYLPEILTSLSAQR